MNLATLEFTPQNRPLLLIGTMRREHMFGRINCNALKLHPGGPFVGF
ncbi:MAG: hypothetical protein ACLPG5_00550 [Acidocella sp.]